MLGDKQHELQGAALSLFPVTRCLMACREMCAIISTLL